MFWMDFGRFVKGGFVKLCLAWWVLLVWIVLLLHCIEWNWMEWYMYVCSIYYDVGYMYYVCLYCLSCYDHVTVVSVVFIHHDHVGIHGF